MQITTPKNRQYNSHQVEAPLSDPIAEKERQRQLQLKAQEEIADDLFSGFIVKDEPATPKSVVDDKSAGAATPKSSVTAPTPKSTKKKPDAEDWFFLHRHFETTADVKEFANEMVTKVTEVEGKGHMRGCTFTFLSKLYACLLPALSLKECEDLEKKIAEAIRVRKLEKTGAMAAKNKVNAVNKNTKFDVSGALDERYGYDDEDWDEGEWGAGEWGGEGGEWGAGDWK